MRPFLSGSLRQQQKMFKNSARTASKGPNRNRIPIPLEPLKDGHSIDPKERTFLEAAERGDKHTMIRCLQPPNPVNVNCTNILGRSAIQIAVDNENVEIVELLLQQEQVKIGDALLYAIREGVYKIVEMLINHPSITSDMLANDWAKTRQPGEESSDYSPDISPIILAAHCNQFEILQLLLSRGATIEKPHPLSCTCRKCQIGMHTDSLRYSLRRIHTYKALASPAWISLTSDDPVLTAFKLSWELEHLAMRENEFKDIYVELSNQCKKYSCDLLDLCRSTEEVIAVMNKKSDSDSEDCADDERERLTLSRLKLALKYEQKQFVAHPNCQQLLTSIWYEGLPVWRRGNGVMKALLSCGLIACMPIVAFYYLIFPRSRLGGIIRSPFMKFMYHSASFGFFLLLLVLASTRTEGTERSIQNIRGPFPSLIEWLIFFWVTGMVWSECKQLWEEGLKAYVRQWWNWLDFIMLSLYLATYSLKAVAFFQIQSTRYGPGNMERSDWPDNDPTLIAEGVFAVANVFSFARIIYLFQTNPHLGPLQISLGCMIIDIAKFLFIFFLVLTSFACGLNQLYWYYDSSTEYCETKVVGGENVTFNCMYNPDAFMTPSDVSILSIGLRRIRASTGLTRHPNPIGCWSDVYEGKGLSSVQHCRIDASYTSLLWSLFGVIPIKDISARKDQAFTKWVGHALLGAYMIMAMTVMINMLIAMMSRSFQDIEDHADMEWKFARSKLWMGYFDQGSTLPPPFNIIISPKAIFYFLRGLHWMTGRMCQKCSEFFNKPSFDRRIVKPIQHRDITYIHGEKKPVNTKQNGINPQINIATTQTNVNYQEVMKRLVSRYIHQTKKQLRQDGVNEDDLLEIKQDISSLRYELREDRKREAARNTGQLDSIKRDIIRSLRGNSSWNGVNGSHGGHGVHDGGPPPCNYDPGEYGQHPGNTSHHNDFQYSGLLTSSDVEILKQEIVTSLKNELREFMREVHHNNPQPPSARPPFVPNVPSDLYQTHLFTQL